MDSSRFDALTKGLSAAGSRRRVLGGLLAGALGTVLSGASAVEAAKKKKPCPPCKKRKNGKCRGTLPDGTACSGGTCQGGRCIAAPPPLPVPFCAGKNTCAQDETRECQQPGSSATCFCFIRADTAGPVCAAPITTAVNCEACPDGLVCVVAGGRCGGNFICVTPCPSPL